MAPEGRKMTTSPDDASVCLWCEKDFTPRRDGGKRQVFCRPACRRDFDAAGRRWVAEAIGAGMLTAGELRDGLDATRALPGANNRLSLMPETRSLDDARSGWVARFLVEIPSHTLEALVRFGWLRSDQHRDLAAIMRALRYLNQEPRIRSIA
jgi:hypothetical protein